MSDRQAVIWTRAGGDPIKMGDLVITDTESRFTYTPGFLEHTRLSGLSLLATLALFANQTIT
ncbi:MAG: hypothetical protein OEY38_14760 [Gammaproteobacteria bacterium]|nr:hypothetical protein [Gammaproteobacteria bacterium]